MADTHRDEIEKLEALYASNPAGRVFTHLADAYRKAGEPGRAREILAGGLERHPDYPSAHVVLGRVLLDLGEKEAAAEAFRKVLELDRHNLIALRGLGDLAVEAGRFAEARHYFGELTQVDPGDLETAERLGALPDDEPEATESVWDAWTEPEAEREIEGVEAGAVDATATPEPGGAPEWANGRGAGESGGLEGFEPGFLSFAEEVRPEEAPTAEAGEPADAPVGGGETSPLDAWVESLNVLGPEPELPDYPGSAAGPEDAPAELEVPSPDLPVAPAFEDVAPAFEAEGTWPEAGATGLAGEQTPEAPPVIEDEAATESGMGAGPIQAEAGEEGGLAEAILEAEAEALYPGPEPVEPEAMEWAAELEVLAEGVVAEPEAESPGDWPAEPEPEAALGEAGPADEVRGTTVEAELESAWWGDPEIHGTVPDPVEWVSQEDWERIAAYGAWTGTADVEETVEAVPELEPEWGESGPDEDADEVATETLAEVYAAQGFRNEAADIYRKLLRRRPDDQRLLSRLAALEGERTGPAEEAGYEAGDEAPGEVWLEPVEPTWPGADELVVAGPTPYAWVEAGIAPEVDEGESIGDRLRGLLAWQPESAPEPEPTLLLEDVAAEPEVSDYSRQALPPSGPTGAVPAVESQGDDDLDMFRSWLRSLRK